MLTKFIFMLTRDDVTVADAMSVYREAAKTDVEYIGFKDIGLPLEQMKQLVAAIHADGRRAMLEVVSISGEAELRSARAAIKLGVDHLIGGTRWKEVCPIIGGTGILYAPYVGRPVGHPAKLQGSVAEIVGQAKSMKGHVDGINLLAYRHETLDGAELAAALMPGVDVPLICAGSVDSLQRVADLSRIGVWAFTIGTAILEGVMVPGASVAGQIQAVLATAADPGRATPDLDGRAPW